MNFQINIVNKQVVKEVKKLITKLPGLVTDVASLIVINDALDKLRKEYDDGLVEEDEK